MREVIGKSIYLDCFNFETFVERKRYVKYYCRKVSSARLELATFRVWGGRDNHYTTKTSVTKREIILYLNACYILQYCFCQRNQIFLNYIKAIKLIMTVFQ